MKKIILLCLLTAFTLISSVSLCQDETKAPPVKITKLSENLHVVSIYYVNMLVSTGDDGVLIVDSGYEQAADNLLSEIRKLGGNNINYIINTHWHFDHCEGNRVFGNNAKIISHRKVRELLSQDRFLLGDTIKAYQESSLPSIVFEDKYEMTYNGDTIRMMSYSGGHSAGDIAVHFVKDNVIHIGDMVFSDMFSFIDVDHGGNIITLADNVRKLLTYLPKDIKIITGHGRIYSTEDLKEHLKMIEETTNIVNAEIAKGKSLKEMQDENVLRDWAEWGKAFKSERWLEFLYRSLLED